jgi:hypothetical protein
MRMVGWDRVVMGISGDLSGQVLFSLLFIVGRDSPKLK